MTLEPDDPELHAEKAGLRYITDDRPGVRRRRAGKGFTYIGPDGTRIADAERIAWFNALAIPPAWTEVWISPIRRGHIQATGRDARGRKQYRYHPRWREVRDGAKYGRLIEFARALPRIRRWTDRDLRRRGLPREKVLALVVRLLEATLIRVGNDEYARENRSYGLSTMRNRHVEVAGAEIRFAFRGKGGKEHEIDVRDRRLAALVRRCQELPGQQLFQYADADGGRRDVSSDDVNEYLREISGEPFTAKDFRTWAGSVLAASNIAGSSCFDSDLTAASAMARAAESVAQALGNTAAVCRKCYIHPAVLEAYRSRDLFDLWMKRNGTGASRRGLTREESALMRYLAAASAKSVQGGKQRRSTGATSRA
jgi:DNA topoisomerase-1